MIRPTPAQRAEMAAFIDAEDPGLLDDLGIERTVCGTVHTGHVCHGRCGFIVDLPHEHAAHVTEHIIYELGLHEEHRQLADGQGGISTDYETGVTTIHSVPCTQQTRCLCWVGHGACGGCSGYPGIIHEPACGWEWNPDCPVHHGRTSPK